MPVRCLVLTADPDVLEDLLRLAAAAGTEIEVAPDAGAARRSWAAAPLVVVATDALPSLERSRLPRRGGVVLLHDDLDDAEVWQRAVGVGAEHVVFLPDAERWLSERLADAAEGGTATAPVVAVLGGRGGAGATTFACALGLTAARTGRRALLVDGDPLGGGVDLVLGGEDDRGVRWPDLAGTRGRVPSAALVDALPTVHGLSVLSWDRGPVLSVPVEAVRAVLDAGRRAADLVVVDLPRVLDDASRAVLAASTTALLVVPAEVRAAAAASPGRRVRRRAVRRPAPGRARTRPVGPRGRGGGGGARAPAARGPARRAGAGPRAGARDAAGGARARTAGDGLHRAAGGADAGAARAGGVRGHGELPVSRRAVRGRWVHVLGRFAGWHS